MTIDSKQSAAAPADRVARIRGLAGAATLTKEVAALLDQIAAQPDLPRPPALPARRWPSATRRPGAARTPRASPRSSRRAGRSGSTAAPRLRAAGDRSRGAGVHDRLPRHEGPHGRPSSRSTTGQSTAGTSLGRTPGPVEPGGRSKSAASKSGASAPTARSPSRRDISTPPSTRQLGRLRAGHERLVHAQRGRHLRGPRGGDAVRHRCGMDERRPASLPRRDSTPPTWRRAARTWRTTRRVCCCSAPSDGGSASSRPRGLQPASDRRAIRRTDWSPE